MPELCPSADCLWQEGFYLWYQCLFSSVFQSTGLFCLFYSDGEGWIHALGTASHLAGHRGRREYGPNVADLKLFWFCSVGPFGLLRGSGRICRWGTENPVMGELDVDKMLIMQTLGVLLKMGNTDKLSCEYPLS